VWQRNIPALSAVYRVIAPDLRGHGESDKPRHGFHVSRLAMDLREFLVYLIGGDPQGLGGKDGIKFKAIGGSLGCSILWYVVFAVAFGLCGQMP
jgi:pimeloyl-ACP methyl ester carboxylesterase